MMCNREPTAELDIHLATPARNEWAELLDGEDLWWMPMLKRQEVIEDPQAAAAGALVEMPLADLTMVGSVALPASLGNFETVPAGPASEVGQPTEEILLELGYDWEKIGELRNGVRATQRVPAPKGRPRDRMQPISGDVSR